MNTQEVKTIYDKLSGRYDFFMWPFEFFVLGKLRCELLKLASGKVLEVGVGTGVNLSHYPKKVTEIITIDLSPEMLQVAKKRATKTNKNISFEEANAEHLNFPDNSFDTVTVVI